MQFSFTFRMQGKSVVNFKVDVHLKLHFSDFNRDERDPLNSPMDTDSMKKPLSVEYDGRSVHSRSGDLIGKNSSV